MNNKNAAIWLLMNNKNSDIWLLCEQWQLRMRMSNNNNDAVIKHNIIRLSWWPEKMKNSNMISFVHSYGERCLKTQFFCCSVNNDNNVHIHWEQYSTVMSNNLWLSYNLLHRKMSNDERLMYASVSNGSNRTIISFPYDGVCLKWNIDLILYHIWNQIKTNL